MSRTINSGYGMKFNWTKLASVRLWITILLVGTLCYSVFKAWSLVELALTDPVKYTSLKDLIMFVLGAFLSITGAVVTSYFNRTDRAPVDTLPEIPAKELSESTEVKGGVNTKPETFPEGSPKGQGGSRESDINGEA